MTDEEFKKSLAEIDGYRDCFRHSLERGVKRVVVDDTSDMVTLKDIPYTHQDFFQDMDILDKEEEHLREFYKNHR